MRRGLQENKDINQPNMAEIRQSKLLKIINDL